MPYVSSHSGAAIDAAVTAATTGATESTSGVVELATQTEVDNASITSSDVVMRAKHNRVQFISTGKLKIGDVSGNSIGTHSINIQTGRTLSTQVASGSYSISMGYGSASLAEASIALGPFATTENIRDIAIGYFADCQSGTSTGRIAIGYNARVSGTLSSSAVAIGYEAFSTGFNSISIGNFSKVTNHYGIAIGNSAYAKESSAIAIGDSNAEGTDSIAIGRSATTASGFYGFALRAIAIGPTANAKENYDIAIGYNASSGYGQYGTGASIVIGLNAAISSGGYSADSIIIGNSAYGYAGYGNIAIGKQASTGSEYGISIGNSSSAGGFRSIAIGDAATANTDRSISIGYSTSAATESVVIGDDASATGSGSVVIGNGASSTSTDNIVIGTAASASVYNGGAIGHNVTNSASGYEGILEIGYWSTTSIRESAVRIVGDDSATADLAVCITVQKSNSAKNPWVGTEGAEEPPYLPTDMYVVRYDAGDSHLYIDVNIGGSVSSWDLGTAV